MAHRNFDEQMAGLDAYKGQTLDTAGLALLRKTLAGKSNLLVAKAAKLAEENQRADLVPDLLSAFERFFVNPEKSDPQCWAKNAISRALSRLGCREKEVYLRGLHHHQWEPIWGGRSDSAGTLRANCAHALIGCEGVIGQDILVLLLDMLADQDKAVRVEAALALGQLDELAVPVLRLFARLKFEDPNETEVVSVCFRALLTIEKEAAIRFVSDFLHAANDASAEAAFALAEMHQPDALAALLAARAPTSAADPWFTGVMLSAIALTRLPEASAYLIALVEREDRNAEFAIEALLKAAPSHETKVRLHEAIRSIGSPRLLRAFDQHSGDVERT